MTSRRVCLLQSAAVCHVLAIRSVSRLGEQSLQGSEYVLMCVHRDTNVLCAAVEEVAKVVDSEAFARAFVMFELSQVRDRQSQELGVGGGPVLNYVRLVEVL
jgi:hypothetical protein